MIDCKVLPVYNTTEALDPCSIFTLYDSIPDKRSSIFTVSIWGATLYQNNPKYCGRQA